MFSHKIIPLISTEEREEYYYFLSRAFKKEFLGISNRQIIENLTKRSHFSSRQSQFLKNIVRDFFQGKKIFQQATPLRNHMYHPINLINYIVAEGYSPNSGFIHWVYKKLGVRWSAVHWFVFLQRDIAPIDAAIIKTELKRNPQEIPPLLELYYKLGVGLERAHVHPGKGIRKSIIEEFKGEVKYKGFDPIDYLLDYYGELDIELMTLTKALYQLLLEKRKKLPKKSTALIVGNGPIPDDAHVLSMIPEIEAIIPADIDPRNNKIMKMHTGGRNPLATQKAKHGEEHSDYVYYLFEKATRQRIGLFAVREITAVKTRDPIFVDIDRVAPLDMRGNSLTMKHISPDLVEVPYCPESITNQPSVYQKYIRNIAGLVRPGKFLLMMALKNARYYRVGNRKLPAIPVDEQILSQEFYKNGFKNIEIRTVKAHKSKSQRGYLENMILWAEKK